LYHSALEKIAKILEEGISQGNFIAVSPESIANVIWALFLGIVIWEDSKRIIYHDHDHFMQTLDNAFEIFGRGLINAIVNPTVHPKGSRQRRTGVGNPAVP